MKTQTLEQETKTYQLMERGEGIYYNSQTIQDLIDSLLDKLSFLKKLKEAGADLISSEEDECLINLTTDNHKLARELGFEEMTEEEW